MNDINQSQDAAEEKPRLSRPDIFTRAARTHLSRRDMVKASVVAGGLVWSAPLLLSGNKAAAQATCCPTGSSTVTVTIDADGNIGCGTPTCLGGPACDPDILACIDDFVQVSDVNISVTLPIVGTSDVAAIGITLSGGATLAAVAAETTGGLLGGGCMTIGDCPDLGVAVPPVVIQVDGLIAVVNVNLLFGDIDHIELEICVPGSATGLCA